MIGFKDFLYLKEMAYNNYIIATGSREEEFKNNIDSKLMKLVKDGINSEHYKLYRYGTGQFFLSDENNKYLGFVDGYLKDKKLYISMTNSKIKGNFYNLMFTSILGLTEIEEIISDESLSPSAIKAYSNLKNKSQLNVRVLVSSANKDTYIEFSDENLNAKRSNKVSITEGEDFNILNKFLEGFSIPTIYRLYVDRDKCFNNRIYCESEVY